MSFIDRFRRRVEKRRLESLLIGTTVKEMADKLEIRVEIIVKRAEAKGVKPSVDSIPS